MKKEHINEIKGISILALGLILFASLISFLPEDLPWYASQPNVPPKNLIGIVGAYTAGTLFFIFGYSSYFLVLALFFWSWNKFMSREMRINFSKLVSCFVLLCVVSGLFSMIGPQFSTMRFQRSGMVGYVIADFLIQYLDRTGAYIILFSIGALTLVLTGEFLVSPLLFKLTEMFHDLMMALRTRMAGKKKGRATDEQKAQPKFSAAMEAKIKEEKRTFNPAPFKFDAKKKEDEQSEEDAKSIKQAEEDSARAAEAAKPKKPVIRIANPENSDEEKEDRNPEPLIVGNYTLPGMDLLSDPPQVSTSQLQSDLELGARTLEQTLADFSVSARVADIERGPVITRYELEPAPGVKIQKITTLTDDIALAMRAPAVRIVAPIPGKNRVGIEVPNNSTASVYLKEVIAQGKFRSAESKLTLGIGKDISGKALIADLTDMPHLLIAGTTGSGKTVCVNSLIMSMLFKATPEDVKFMMVDPKMVELSQFNEIPHMLCPVVTDPKKVSAALNWVVGEMEARYSLLSKAGARNIKGYHAKGFSMPYIVIIIDELADLMQVSAKTIESAITRLAQLSRAVGIHLILATQRPSVDVITGVIKANFPARISFKVASKVDSRTVLDMNGAESLLGKGDLLFMKPGDAKPTRGQCSFVTDEEVTRVIDFIKQQQAPVYNEKVLKHEASGGAGGMDEKDDLYDEAVKLVIETNQASVSILQRRMRLGYTRAARLIDMMEQYGVVGPYCGSKAREILVDREEWLLNNMNTSEEKPQAE